MPEGSKRRPARLDLNNVTPVEPGPNTAAALKGLRTPKELANDIAIQCVSPAIPTFLTNGAILKAKSIEAQQKRLIAERQNNNHHQNQHQQHQINGGNINLNVRTPMVASIDQKTPPPTSARKRKPERIEIYPAYMVTKPRINSAPVYRGGYMPVQSYHPNYPNYPQKHQLNQNTAFPGSRSVSGPDSGSGAGSSGGNIRRTTIYLDASGNRIGSLNTSTPTRSSRPASSTTRGANSQGTNDVNDVGSDSDEAGGGYADPEDAALSDAEAEVDPEAEDPEYAVRADLASRKMRFLELCSELFDLMAVPGNLQGHILTDSELEAKKAALMTSVLSVAGSGGGSAGTASQMPPKPKTQVAVTSTPKAGDNQAEMSPEQGSGVGSAEVPADANATRETANGLVSQSSS